MKIEELKSKGLKKEYKVTIPAKDMQKKVEEKVAEVAKTVKLPGFRPGHAPKEMLMQKYKNSVMGEALDDLVNEASNELIKKNSLKPAMAPSVKITKFEEDKDIEFDVSVEVLPEIKVNDLSAIKLEKLTAEVPAEEVEKTLNYLSSSRRETVKLEEKRVSQKGDVLVIDFVGSVDGVEFQGGKGNDYPLELGSNSFIPGFEDQLIGKNAGDKVDVNVKFPKEYHAKDLADKDSLFKVEIKEIRVKKDVEINDEFAKSMGEKDLAALKEKISARIKQDYDSASRMKLKRALLDVLDNEYKFELPESLVEAEFNSIKEQYEHAKKHNQLDEEEKAKPEKDLLDEYKTISARRVKLGLLLSEIGREAKITVNPEDINKAIMAEAQKYPGQEKMVFDYYLKNKQAIESLKAPVFEEKIIDHILEKASVTDKVVSLEELYSFDEAKAKKPATKKKAAK